MRSLFVVDSKVACDFIRFRQGSVLNRFSKLFLQDLLKNLTSDYCCWNKSVQTDQSFYVLRKPASVTSMVSCTNRCVHFFITKTRKHVLIYPFFIILLLLIGNATFRYFQDTNFHHNHIGIHLVEVWYIKLSISILNYNTGPVKFRIITNLQ